MPCKKKYKRIPDNLVVCEHSTCQIIILDWLPNKSIYNIVLANSRLGALIMFSKINQVLKVLSEFHIG